MFSLLRNILIGSSLSAMMISCGKDNQHSTNDIVGGRVVTNTDAEARTTVALMRGSSSFCTGTLIGPRYVITAAHCLRSPNFTIGFGLSARTATEVNIESMIRNPEGFDIGLVKLASPAPDFASVTALASDDIEIERGDELILAGFGQTAARGGSSGVLKTVRTRFDQFNIVDKEVWFGPTPGSSACRGDSGGPMFLEIANGGGSRLVLLGTTIGGFRPPACSGSGRYSDVRAHRNWIESVVN